MPRTLNSAFWSIGGPCACSVQTRLPVRVGPSCRTTSSRPRGQPQPSLADKYHSPAGQAPSWCSTYSQQREGCRGAGPERREQQATPATVNAKTGGLAWATCGETASRQYGFCAAPCTALARRSRPAPLAGQPPPRRPGLQLMAVLRASSRSASATASPAGGNTAASQRLQSHLLAVRRSSRHRRTPPLPSPCPFTKVAAAYRVQLVQAATARPRGPSRTSTLAKASWGRSVRSIACLQQHGGSCSKARHLQCVSPHWIQPRLSWTGARGRAHRSCDSGLQV